MKITWKELVPAEDCKQRQLASGTLLLTVGGDVVLVGEVSWFARSLDGKWSVDEHGCGCCAGPVIVTHYSDDLVSIIEEAERAMKVGEG